MSDSIGKCCGQFFRDNECPNCHKPKDKLISKENEVQVSRFLSGLLRHFPSEYGVNLDNYGWAELSDVANAVRTKYSWMNRQKLLAVVEMDKDGRYEITDVKIRASYGHNADLDISLENTEYEVPSELYHATTPEDIDKILSNGLKSMGRKMVHLSSDMDEAISKGRRHTENPVLICVDSESLQESGIEINKRGRTTFTAEETISPKYFDTISTN